MPRRFNKSERDEWCHKSAKGEALGDLNFYAHMEYIGEASMPPEGPPVQQQDTALPYNPGAYEGMVEGMHPAAQYTYERAVQQGAPPQAAMAAAQEKQGEMMKRTQEGQNTEGVQIPVISGKIANDLDLLKQEYEDLMRQGRIEAAQKVLAERDRLLSQPDTRSGFVSSSTIQRVSHLIS